MSNKKIRTRNKAHFTAIVSALVGQGFNVDDLGDDGWYDSHREPVYIYIKGHKATWKAGKDAHPSWPSIATDDIFDLQPRKEASVKVGRGLNALVTADSVTIGSLTLSFDKVNELVEEMDNLQELTW